MKRIMICALLLVALCGGCARTKTWPRFETREESDVRRQQERMAEPAQAQKKIQKPLDNQKQKVENAAHEHINQTARGGK